MQYIFWYVNEEAVAWRCFVKKCSQSYATLLKKLLWHRCFPVNFAILLRTVIFIEHLSWLSKTNSLQLQSAESFQWKGKKQCSKFLPGFLFNAYFCFLTCKNRETPLVSDGMFFLTTLPKYLQLGLIMM